MLPPLHEPPLRIEYAGAVYHITSCGNEKKDVFKDDQDRINLQNTLEHVNKLYNWLRTFRVVSYGLTVHMLRNASIRSRTNPSKIPKAPRA